VALALALALVLVLVLAHKLPLPLDLNLHVLQLRSPSQSQRPQQSQVPFNLELFQIQVLVVVQVQELALALVLVLGHFPGLCANNLHFLLPSHYSQLPPRQSLLLLPELSQVQALVLVLQRIHDLAQFLLARRSSKRHCLHVLGLDLVILLLHPV
jgi:hypothetical protein